jgi:NAD(P) transhydrogenase subunit alpha
MKVGVLKERQADELRVAVSPDSVKKLVGLGFSVSIETGAGAAASFTDEVFTAAGAAIVPSAQAAVGDADLVLKVRGPMADEVGHLKSGAIVMGHLAALTNKDAMKALADRGVIAFAMELLPRITRAQSMDILSSQSNLAGYKAVLDAAAVYGRAFPMMMTAAGTVPPAKVFVMGAGVAGLQAIATAKRLGAVVTATDVRPAVKEQVESLGGKFLMVEDKDAANAETAGGYAKEMSDDYQRRQAELVKQHLTKQDIVITTALIPGKPAPVLVTEEMLKGMPEGSVLVDLAVEAGGNCPLSEFGKVVKKYGVTIVGHANVPARLAQDASTLFAKNLLNFITPQVKTDTKTLAVNWDDEIIKGTLICKDGKLVHPALAQ